jgi:beta-carotene/zeaxanthin 4-ketolase
MASSIYSNAHSLQSIQGVLVAIIILTIWMVSLLTLLSIDLTHYPLGFVGCALLWQVFLYSGIFITAHDAMHGSVFPGNVQINNAIGTIALLLYGLFSFKDLSRKHWQHHKHPSTDRDPDFHDGQHINFFSWYFQFMKRYWSWTRLAALILVFHTIKYFLHIPEANLMLFWIVPSILSSVQLFYFGTFLPHRQPKGGYTNPHRAETNHLPLVLSFLTCYHFGYHQEHHEYPSMPWWRLPEIHELLNQRRDRIA